MLVLLTCKFRFWLYLIVHTVLNSDSNCPLYNSQNLPFLLIIIEYMIEKGEQQLNTNRLPVVKYL